MRRPDVVLGFAGAACAVGAIEHAQVLYETLEPSPYGNDGARRLIGSAPLILWTTAAALTMRSERLLPVAAGLVLFAGRMESLAVSTALMGMHVVVPRGAKGTSTVKDRLSLFAASALAALCVHGLAEDAAATVAARSEEWMSRWYPDDPTERAVRVFAELATLASIAAFVRGRTWGALFLPLAGLALVACAMMFRGLVWGAGCVGHLHALHDSESLVLGLIAVALMPWLAPMARALADAALGRRRATHASLTRPVSPLGGLATKHRTLSLPRD
ncbi:MAG: hypothetical protein J0L92_15180 [Deltaproteobacteria bacterium]|nr:hypothetical protein [Deltaproteobacteria bacterium]